MLPYYVGRRGVVALVVVATNPPLLSRDPGVCDKVRLILRGVHDMVRCEDVYFNIPLCK